MGLNININVCDITGKAYGPKVRMDVVEVYKVGGRYPEENECLTSLTLAPDVLPEHEGEFTVYTDDDFNVVAFNDTQGVRTPTDDETELADEISEALSRILSEEYDRTNEIDSLIVNDREITDELRTRSN